MSGLESRFRDHLLALGLTPGRVVLGVSGGSDSLALLLLMHRVAPPLGFDLLVAHADHGLHPESARVAEMVRTRAESLGVQALIGELELPSEAGETDAREARHAWLETVCREAGAAHLVLAHHREDQAETVLMRVLAGSGPAGLAGMAPRHGRVVRPLLGFSREELAQYRTSHGWTAWEDPANANVRHARSWLRASILPQLVARDAATMDRLVRLSAQAAESRAAWDGVLDLLPDLSPRSEKAGVSVAAAPLVGYDSGLARVVIQALGRRVGATLSRAAADRALALASGGRSGRSAPMGGGWSAELAFGRLRIVPDQADRVSDPLPLGGTAAGEARFGRWALRWRPESAPGQVPRDGWTSWFIPGACVVRGWHRGDEIRPRGGRGRRLAVRCMQDARVPRSDRTGWPVVVGPEAGPIWWIPGVCRAEDAIPPSGSEAMRIDVVPG